jgi:hypothetical protein
LKKQLFELIIFSFFKLYLIQILKTFFSWGLGIGVFGDWGLGIGPNPQSPIPNPQSPIIFISKI